MLGVARRTKAKVRLRTPNPIPVPISPPTNNPNHGGKATSRGAAVGISLTVVFFVIFVASMFLYRRYKHDMRNRPEQMIIRDEHETTGFDNTGQNVDWRKPYYPGPPGQYSGPSTPPPPQDNPDASRFINASDENGSYLAK